MLSDFRLLLTVMSAPWRGTFWTPRIVLPKTAEAARRRSKLIAAPDFAIVLASMGTLRGWTWVDGCPGWVSPCPHARDHSSPLVQNMGAAWTARFGCSSVPWVNAIPWVAHQSTD